MCHMYTYMYIWHVWHIHIYIYIYIYIYIGTTPNRPAQPRTVRRRAGAQCKGN